MLNRKIDRKREVILFLIIVFLVSFSSNVAADWYKGSLHQHTGFSTHKGYDNIENTGDECYPPLEGFWGMLHDGYNVTDLAESAIDKNRSFLSFSDHSYCMDESEFQTVKDDCDYVNNNPTEFPNFKCLSGVELSVSDKYGYFEIENNNGGEINAD